MQLKYNFFWGVSWYIMKALMAGTNSRHLGYIHSWEQVIKKNM